MSCQTRTYMKPATNVGNVWLNSKSLAVMVNWQDPANIELQFFGLVKLTHLVFGIFTWEVLSTLYFDWEVITRKRVFKWPFVIYVTCRFCTVMFLVCSAVGFSDPIRFNCQVWIIMLYGSGYLGIALASALLALRTIAFWNNNRIVIGAAFSLWLLNTGVLLYGVTQGRSEWDPATGACMVSNTERNLPNFLVTVCSDFALLTIMLSKIWHRRKAGALWTLVYYQGVFWVAGAAAGELPGIILTILNYNDAMNLLLQPVSALAMTLCATRMYRELCEYAKPGINAQEMSIDISPMKPSMSGPVPRSAIDFSITNVSDGSRKKPSVNMTDDESTFGLPVTTSEV